MTPTTFRTPPQQLSDPRLGRIPEFDAQSLNYPMRELAKGLKPKSKKWKIRQRLNQGQSPMCVGFSIAMEIGMQPYYHNITDFLAQVIYHEAQKIDYWPGEGYDGTSNLAGMTVAKNLGIIPEFRWALKPDPLEDIILMLANKGPVVLGTNWYEGMYTPDSEGLVHKTGRVVGGHNYVLSTIDWRRKIFYSPNTWGDAGFWISFADVEALIFEDGEAAIPTIRD